MGPRLCAVLLSMLVLAGCAHKREVSRAGCALRMLPIELDPLGGAAASTDAPSFRSELRRLLGSQSLIASAGRPHHLVLSGGGKWGSFGAGFLRALPDRPEYRIVTGVSTGALQATFAFIAEQPVPAERAAIYTAANDLALAAADPQPGAGRRFVDDLPRAYTVTSSDTIVTVHGKELTALRRGGAGDFTPLRARLATLIDADVLQRVAAEAANSRGLYVGVVDMDDGRAYAVDLLELAKRATAPGADFARLQGCYVDTLVASSSEPLLVRPVFLERADLSGPAHMYMDGGMRYGVFLEEAMTASGDPRLAEPAIAFDTTVILNGDLTVRDPWQAPNAKWSLIDLLARSKDVLVDQIYRFSIDRVEDFGGGAGTVKLATARGYRLHDFEGTTCEKLQEAGTGIAFPPDFMRCLIDYGRVQATDEDKRWDND